MPEMGAIKQVEISAILQDFRPFPGTSLENMWPTMLVYPPKDALSLGECSAHRIMSVRLIVISFLAYVLIPPVLKVLELASLFTELKTKKSKYRAKYASYEFFFVGLYLFQKGRWSVSWQFQTHKMCLKEPLTQNEGVKCCGKSKIFWNFWFFLKMLDVPDVRITKCEKLFSHILKVQVSSFRMTCRTHF